MEMVGGLLSLYKDHDAVIDSSTSGKYLSKELSMLGYIVNLISPAKVPRDINQLYENRQKEFF